MSLQLGPSASQSWLAQVTILTHGIGEWGSWPRVPPAPGHRGAGPVATGAPSPREGIGERSLWPRVPPALCWVCQVGRCPGHFLVLLEGLMM